ncbi:SMI1/KNR4 family protein [Runella sp. SP2]|uniref:SMI1/KNR4 family protein n=1 Tax=Runella sp. SP2 TaxID=2268026 RepID=UPI000F07366B|nr:SMI1/KNR4 family protein [Runella sp. SP2]AYQ33883.1 SMI1/KNR4 family protein [Runella sp. SP2]
MAAKDMKTIWQVPKYLPYVQPNLTDEIIKEAEKKIGYKLPNEYLELLTIQNGGYIRYTIKDTLHSQISGIGPYYPSITAFEWLKEYEGLSFEVDALFPFDGDGHWNICLDYRQNKDEPEITYIDTEIDFEKPIARNFKEYIDKLIIETENQFVIETNAPITETLKFISISINNDFGQPDLFAHGYPIYSNKFNDNWIWVSPNKVPNGFIRQGEDRYEELKGQMEIQSVQFPEIDKDFLLITFSGNEQAEELTTLFRNNGLTIRELSAYLNKSSNR